MNILFLTKYPVNDGSITVVMGGIIRELRGADVNIIIFSSDDSAQQCHELEGAKVVYGKLPKPKLFNTKKDIQHLIDVCQNNNIDAVHCHGAYRPGFAAMLLNKYTQIPYILTSHHDIHPISGRTHKRSFRRRMAKILQNSAAITHLSKPMEDAAHSFSDTSEKDYSIANAIDLEWWRQPVEPIKGNYILGLGRLISVKNFDFIIAVFIKMYADGFTTPLVIAGTGKELDNLRKQVLDAGLNLETSLEGIENFPNKTICLPGSVIGDQKRALFAGAQFTVFPTRFEAFGLVLIEAMVSGKAIVASDLDVFSDIAQNNHNGFLVAESDVNAWCNAITELSSNTPLRNKFEQNNCQDVNAFNWHRIASQYHEVYTDIIQH